MKKFLSTVMSTVLLLGLCSLGVVHAEGADTRVIGPKSLPTISKASGQEGANLIFREKKSSAWSQNELFVFTLPDGVVWAEGTKVNGEEVVAKGRELEVKFKGTKTIDQFVISPVVDIMSRVPFGDLEVSVDAGPIAPEDGRIAFAKISDFGLLVNPKETREIVYGDRSPKTVKVRLEELIDNSLIRSTGYIMTLENATFNTKKPPMIAPVEGPKKIDAKYLEDALVISTNSQAGKSSWDIVFEIVPNEDYVGDITLKFDGRNEDYSFVVATVSKDSEVTMEEVKNLSLGYQDQLLPAITVKEAREGGLPKGSYVLSIDPVHDTNFIQSAKVEVTEGDLLVGNVAYKGNEITFDVKNASTEPSVIVIKDAKMTLGKGAFLGEYKVNLSLKGKEMTSFAQMLWFNATAPTGDPAQPDPARVAQFVIGKTEFNLFLKGQKETKEFDVAPFIESGRTMLSVRAIGESLGMVVSYDEQSKTVTIDSDAKKVELKVGDKVAVVNGSPVPMDVAPVVKEGRIFVPVSHIGQFFGAETAWDAALKMVTVTMK